MQEIICAKTNARLLSKAERLFTGSVDGRIIEVLQNARRAGATEVRVSNKNGIVTVQDNGSGIHNFQTLLDLGGSGWDEQFEVGEDPAGVGLFSLAPKQVEITSGRKKVVINKDGWTGKPVKVARIAETVNGTLLKFCDEKPWDMELVETHAVFSGMKVVVDGRKCHSIPFCGSQAVNYPSPGFRIEVVKEISKYHRQWISGWHHRKVLVNFHGQVVQMDYYPGDTRQGLAILVDLNDRTDIRLMLPARTRLVENVAFERVKRMVEAEYYRYFLKHKTHTLYYKQWQRARQLGVALPEAEPQYKAGLLWDEYDVPVEVTCPKDFNLQNGYLCYDDDFKDKTRVANVHLLAALGEFKGKPFVPVTIDSGYIGYSWTKLPGVTQVKVTHGNELFKYGIQSGKIACFDKLSISVKTSDGQSFSSEVDLAVLELPANAKREWTDEIVCVTKGARDHLKTENIWLHLGGYDLDGDSYDTQLYYFEQELNEFWNELIGPYEGIRQEMLSVVSRQGIRDKLHEIKLASDGTLEITLKDGQTEIVKPPKESGLSQNKEEVA